MHLELLRVWGETVRFEGFTTEELDELCESFAGGIASATDAAAARLTVRLLRGKLETPADGVVLPRHRASMSGRKLFLDGTEFDQSIQHRDVMLLLEAGGTSWYRADGAGLVTARELAVIVADDLPPMLLSDVVENWLLWSMRERGVVAVHGSAWVTNTEVEMLVGASGVGKTTMMFRKVMEGARFFSNDRIALRLGQSGLEARSFPQPVNVGCGTIRALGMDLPHFDLEDHSKVRLTAAQVLERWRPDYDSWLPVDAIRYAEAADLDANIYWHGDPDHPFWNLALRPRPLLERPFLERAIGARSLALDVAPAGI